MTRHRDRRFLQRAERFHRGRLFRIAEGQVDVPVLARCDADGTIHLLIGYARGLAEHLVNHPADATKLLGRIIRRRVTETASRVAQLRRLSAFEQGLVRDQDFARGYCPSQLFLLGCDVLVQSARFLDQPFTQTDRPR